MQGKYDIAGGGGTALESAALATKSSDQLLPENRIVWESSQGTGAGIVLHIGSDWPGLPALVFTSSHSRDVLESLKLF